MGATPPTLQLIPPPSEAETEVRLLTAAEIESLYPIFEAQGAAPPLPEESAYIGAVRNGYVVAFLVVQRVLHAEPLWIEQGNEVVFSRLVGVAESLIAKHYGNRTVYVFAPAGKVSRMAQLVGMQVEPWVVLSKWVPAEQAEQEQMEEVAEVVEEVKGEPDELRTQ